MGTRIKGCSGAYRVPARRPVPTGPPFLAWVRKPTRSSFEPQQRGNSKSWVLRNCNREVVTFRKITIVSLI